MIFTCILLILSANFVFSFVNLNMKNILRSKQINLKIEKCKYSNHNITEQSLIWNQIVYGTPNPDKEDIYEIYLKRYGEK